jgi:predicted SAM-dependent methyltransferase
MPIPLRIRARRGLVKVRRFVNRYVGPSRLSGVTNPKVVIGSGATHLGDGWIETDQEFLDLLKPSDWARFFKPNSIAALLAEHVWEHLTPEQAVQAAETCFTYLQPGGYFRLAVPDGFNPDPVYQSWVKVGGQSPGQYGNDHKVLYNYRSFGDLFRGAGFETRFYEYFDEAGTFHYEAWDPKDGMIRRSKRFDKRNKDRLTFTSIIMDAFKPKA